MDVLSNLWPFLVLLAVWLFAFIGLRHRRIRSEARRDVQLALLSKFQTGEEITKFLATEEGRRLLDQLAGPQENLHDKTAGLVVPGCVLTCVGIALGIASTKDPDILVAALVVGSVGVALFIGAAFTYRLARKTDGSRKDD